MAELMDKESKTKKIVDYKCKRANASGFSDEIINTLRLEFPKSYNDCNTLALISKSIKKEEDSPICLLPFCHTVEAEALGGFINLSEGKFGPRAAAYAYNSVEELLTLPEIDFGRGRISEVLEACRILKAQGEIVCLEVSGFLTILNSLIDVTKVFKTWRKDAETVERVFNGIAENLYRFFEAAKKAGVGIISYADPAGSVNIVGPKYTDMIAKNFTMPLLKKAAALADENCIIHLCPKTSLILLSLGLAERKDVQFDKGIHYIQACLKTMGKEKIIGQACIKNSRCVLCHGKIRTLQFIHN